MDLLVYDVVDQSDQDDWDLSRATSELREVQDQASAWLRMIVLTVVPGLVAWGGRPGEAHG